MGRAGIEGSGVISPGVDGFIYLTPDDYTSGMDAHEQLALPRRPTGYFEIPEGRLRGVSGPRRVRPRNAQPGGGREQTVQHPIEAVDLVWVGVDQ